MKVEIVMFLFAIIWWIGISIGVEVGCGMNRNGKVHFITPSYFYDKGMNWFGAYFCFILLGIVSPIMFIFKILRWLLTVGR